MWVGAPLKGLYEPAVGQRHRIIKASQPRGLLLLVTHIRYTFI